MFDGLLVFPEGREEELRLGQEGVLTNGQGQGDQGAEGDGGEDNHRPPGQVGVVVDGLEESLGRVYHSVG